MLSNGVILKSVTRKGSHHLESTEDIVQEPNGSGGRTDAGPRPSWAMAWFNFCQETSFNGLRQITEPQPYLLRRLAWTVLVLVGSALFLYQMVEAILYYNSNPVSVNIKINHNDTIEFPAFTVCNKNSFRKTVAYERGWYELVPEWFGLRDLSHGRAEERELTTNTTVFGVYDTCGHALEDLVVRCVWDGRPCGLDDFTPTMTDYGKCYTFNSQGSRLAKRTGTEGGLQLLLNVEQYEYMPGPNEGAGLRVLLHNQNDTPLVKDFGLAISPGSYSLLGSTLIRINNLPHPHGQCNDDIKLKYFESYTKHNCLENCKQEFLEKTCGCSHMNMVVNKESLPHCTVAEHKFCGSRAVEQFNNVERAKCNCPMSCQVDSLEVSSSLGYISSFDALNLLQSNTTDALRPRYLKAKEVVQRVNEKIVHEDIDHVATVKELSAEVERAISRTLDGLDLIETSVHDTFSILDQRLQFHKIKGLNKVKFIMEHDFVRGWTILEERTLPYFTFNFFELRDSFRRVIEMLSAAQNGTAEERLLALTQWAVQKGVFHERLDIAVRVRDNVTEAHEAYTTGVPLLTYRASRGRRYDMTWITVDMLQAYLRETGYDQQKYYDNLFNRMEQVTSSIDTYIEMADNFTQTYQIDRERWDKADATFRWGCIQYNYYIFLYKSRVIDGPVIVADRHIEQFDALNTSLQDAKARLLYGISGMRHAIQLHETTTLHAMRSAIHNAENYLNDTTTSKLDLSQEVTSVEMRTHVKDLELFFSELRLSSRSLFDRINEVKTSLQDIWSNMLLDFSTAPFYQKVHEDLSNFTSDPTYFLPYFANLLDTDAADLQNASLRELEYRMNADFPVTNLSEKVARIEEEYRQFADQTDVSGILGVTDEMFLSAFTEYQVSLDEYAKETNIDLAFYLKNFIQLNVFMQELSYEEIIQQPAYDMQKLLGDIGGSVGLFLGASVLTLAEVFDVIILQLVHVFKK